MHIIPTFPSTFQNICLCSIDINFVDQELNLSSDSMPGQFLPIFILLLQNFLSCLTN